MPRLNRTAFAAMATLALTALPAAAETTTPFKSSGTSFIKLDNYPQADGRIVQHFHVQYVETVQEGDGAGTTRGGECDGMGLVDAAGVYAGHFLCTTSVSADDAFTLEFNDTAAGAEWVVTGGKGKYKGATGKGHMDYTWGDSVFGDRMTWASSGAMVQP